MASKYRFTFGPWNISTGRDPFGPEVRKDVQFAAKIREYKKLGFDGVQFHDDDVVPADLDPQATMKGVAQVKKMRVAMVVPDPLDAFLGSSDQGFCGFKRHYALCTFGQSRCVSALCGLLTAQRNSGTATISTTCQGMSARGLVWVNRPPEPSPITPTPTEPVASTPACDRVSVDDAAAPAERLIVMLFAASVCVGGGT